MVQYDGAMFGHGRRISTLETRADEHEAQLATIGTTLPAIARRFDELQRTLAEDPQQRLALAVQGVSEQLAGRLERALADLDALRRAVDEMKALRERLEASARGEAERAPRVFGELGRTYRAEWTGYVSLYFEGGYTDSVELRVGDTSPPTTVVCTLNSRNDINSYAGGVVRRGEYWLAASSREHGDSGVRCVFTPFA